MERFPQNGALACEHAWIPFREKREDAAAQRFEHVRERFPAIAEGYIGGALCLRNGSRMREAEEMLERAHQLIPGEARILIEHARIPVLNPSPGKRDYDEALRRTAVLRKKFPDCEDGYLLGVRYLREVGRLDEADALAIAGMARLPHSGALALEYGHTARKRADWPEAIRRYGEARDRFPNRPGGVIGLATALSAAGRYAEADALLRDAIERFPDDKTVFAAFASIAVQQSDWNQALARWTEAYRHFPDENGFAQRMSHARTRLAATPEAGAAAAAVVAPADPTTQRPSAGAQRVDRATPPHDAAIEQSNEQPNPPGSSAPKFISALTAKVRRLVLRPVSRAWRRRP